MSYYDYDEAQRQREYERQQERKINIALWPDQMIDNRSSGLLPSCSFDSRVLIVSSKHPDMYFCPDCGNESPINPDPPKPDKAKRQMKPNKPGTGAPSLIIASQLNKRKKRKGTEGDLELRQDLAMTGVIEYSDIQEY